MSDLNGNTLLVACPNCGAELAWDSRNRHRPFCSERCKLTDLGQWAAERYRVKGERINQEATDVAAGKD